MHLHEHTVRDVRARRRLPAASPAWGNQNQNQGHLVWLKLVVCKRCLFWLNWSRCRVVVCRRVPLSQLCHELVFGPSEVDMSTSTVMRIFR